MLLINYKFIYFEFTFTLTGIRYKSFIEQVDNFVGHISLDIRVHLFFNST